MIDELPPEMRELFDAERAAVPDAAVRAAVRSRLTLAMAHGGLGIAALKILSVLALVAGTAAISAVTRPSRSGTQTIVAHETSATHATPVDGRVELVAPPPTATIPRPARVAVQQRPLAHPKAATHEPSPAPRQPSEAVLLGLAWHAIGDSDPRHALALVDEVAQRFPDGALAEEREVIRIQALSATGGIDVARVFATRFLATYPHSVHRSLVQEATR